MVILVSEPSPRRLRSGSTPSDILKKVPTQTGDKKRSTTMINFPSISSSSSTSSSTPSDSRISAISSRVTRVRMNDDQRKARLEQDDDVIPNSVQTRAVKCAGCENAIRLDTKINYGDSNWRTHKKRCPELKKRKAEKAEKEAEVAIILQSLAMMDTERQSKATVQSHGLQVVQQEALSELEYSAVLGLLAIQRKMCPSTV